VTIKDVVAAANATEVVANVKVMTDHAATSVQDAVTILDSKAEDAQTDLIKANAQRRIDHVDLDVNKIKASD
jgi:hypothetical protein